MTNGSLRTRYLKDMFVQYRGMVAALDEGLFKDDPTLASAIWRNVFDASENVDLETLATVVGYVRRCVHKLDKVGDDTVEKGLIYFGNPADEVKTVREPSKRLEQKE
jgi:cytochrome b pre-mRNA-processing protein 3